MALPKFIKWLRPGLRIKRWLAVIFLGVVFAGFSTYILILFSFSVKGMSFYGIDNAGAKLLGSAALGFLLSSFCLITGIYRLIKSMWDLVDRRSARKGLVN